MDHDVANIAAAAGSIGSLSEDVGGGFSILHVIAHLEKGGAEKQLKILATHSKHKNIIAVLEQNILESDLDVRGIPNRNPFVVYETIKDIIDRDHPDIVFLWLPESLTLPALAAAKSKRVPTISADRRAVRRNGAGMIRDRLKYITHVLSDKVISNYPYVCPKVSLRNLLGIPRKVIFIPNAIAIKPIDPPEIYNPDKIMCVGRLVKQKCFDELLQATRQLQNVGITEIHIVGEGPEKTKLQKLAEENKGLGVEIVFHGFVSDWVSKFSSAEFINVLPSRSEGMSNVVFESLAAGYITLVKDSVEFSKLTTDLGIKVFTYENERKNGLVSATANLLNAKSVNVKANVRKNQQVLATLSKEEMTEKYSAEFQSLLSVGGVVR